MLNNPEILVSFFTIAIIAILILMAILAIVYLHRRERKQK